MRVKKGGKENRKCETLQSKRWDGDQSPRPKLEPRLKLLAYHFKQKSPVKKTGRNWSHYWRFWRTEKILVFENEKNTCGGGKKQSEKTNKSHMREITLQEGFCDQKNAYRNVFPGEGGYLPYPCIKLNQDPNYHMFHCSAKKNMRWNPLMHLIKITNTIQIKTSKAEPQNQSEQIWSHGPFFTSL